MGCCWTTTEAESGTTLLGRVMVVWPKSRQEDGFDMAKKPKEIDFDSEFKERLNKLQESVGKEVPLSHHYVRGAKPILMSIEGDLATLQFPNGTVMTKVPIRYLCDDSGYWRS